MATLTDPARELADIAARFSVGSSLRADQFIQMETNFQPWSTTFYHLITRAHERIDTIKRLLPLADIDDDLLHDANSDLDQVRVAFTPPSLMAASNTGGSTADRLRQYGRRMHYLSLAIRPLESYPRYTKDEADVLVEALDEYIDHLKVHGEALAFVQGAMLEGLDALRIRLKAIDWLGAGYALEALRTALVLHAELSRNEAVMSNPDAEAFVRGFGRVVKQVLDVARSAKDFSETSSWAFTSTRLLASAAAGYLLGGGS